ncbi:MAG: CPBP family intramembrane metalloprotease [Lachnospiraceae bacterium]|nr:CPBP family intramembrane metalloprotease [Lachnospiraceae bacterium]
MQTLTKKKSITAALVMFVAVMIMLIFVGAPIQSSLGMLGLLITELLFLSLALIGTKIMKASFKDVFPIKKPRVRQIFGTLFIWLGSYLGVLFFTLLIGYFFPDQLGNTQEGLMGVFNSVPLPIRYLIVAVSPAICEEAVHRGFILHFLKPIQKKWLIVLIMGILFGIFHLDPIRFVATALLGMALSYTALETGSMFYPFLIHLLNNSLSVGATKMMESEEMAAAASAQVITPSVLGQYLLLLCVAPWLLWAGSALLHEKNTEPKSKEQKKANTKILLACILTSAVCLVGGFVMAAGNMMTNAVNTGVQTPTVSQLHETPFTTDVHIEKEGMQQLTAVMETPKGILHISIVDEAGNIAYETSAEKMTGNIPLNLKAGDYTMQVDLQGLTEDEAESDETITFNLILMQF